MSLEEKGFRALLIDGTRLLREGKATQAATILQKAYEMEPESVDAALNYGGALIMSGQFRLAMPVLEALRDREPLNAMVWTNLGAAYLGNPVLATDEQQKQAIAAFERALELDASAPSVAYNLGLIYRDRQEFEQAIDWLRKAVRTNPADRHARVLLKRLQNRDEQKREGTE